MIIKVQHNDNNDDVMITKMIRKIITMITMIIYGKQ